MDMLSEALERIFREQVTPQVIRGIEAGSGAVDLWREIESSGFLDILLPEDEGGAGVSLDDAFNSFLLAGQYAVPLPFVQTVMARGWLHACGQPAPEGAIAIAGPETGQLADGGQSAHNVAFGTVADWVLGEFEGRSLLLPVSAARIEADATRGSLVADLYWSASGEEVRVIERPARPVCSPAQLAAASLTPLLAGAARQALDMTMTHVTERHQFGRAISQFQAVQGQISVMAERVWAMRMAARLAFHSHNALPSAQLAAIGKARCSEAAVTVADISHALHGAIGITEEYDLQLYTRRLREWRRASGTEMWWARQVGEAVIQDSEGTALDFILACTQ